MKEEQDCSIIIPFVNTALWVQPFFSLPPCSWERPRSGRRYRARAHIQEKDGKPHVCTAKMTQGHWVFFWGGDEYPDVVDPQQFLFVCGFIRYTRGTLQMQEHLFFLPDPAHLFCRRHSILLPRCVCYWHTQKEAALPEVFEQVL